jgi:hypothetical protein
MSLQMTSLKKLIQGDEYDDKIWLGLDNTDSLIANYIYQDFLTKQILDFQQKLILKMQPIKHYLASISKLYQKYQGEFYKSLLSMVILLTITDAMI